MKKIQMVDLESQYQRIKNEIDRALSDTLASSAFINGPAVKQLQQNLANYLSCAHVQGCGNGTDALQVALMSLGLRPGDEVITSNFTFIATVEAIAILGLTPVLVDVDPDTFNLDADQLKKALTPKTRAVIPVHLFGQCADMERIMSIANKHHLYVVEDAAQALGADCLVDGTWRKAGTIGDVGCTSFFPSKNLGTYGDGGALFTQKNELATRIRSIVNHGSKVKYYHDDIGVNSRLDSLHAAILNVKLPHLDTYNKRRQEAAAFYDAQLDALDWLNIPAKAIYSTHIYHQYTIQLRGVDRAHFKNYLAQHEIPAMIYYPMPFHKQKAYQYLPYQEGDFPVTEDLCKRVLSLPMHTELDSEQLSYITETIKSYKP